MDASPWIWFAASAAGAAALVWLAARWHFGQRVALLRADAVKLERERQQAAQQQFAAMQQQLDRLQRELAATAARAAARHVQPADADFATASAASRADRLARAEAAFAAAEAASGLRLQAPDAGFADTEPMGIPPSR